MKPFTEEQVELLEQLIRAIIADERPNADCSDILNVQRIKEKMVNAQKETT